LLTCADCGRTFVFTADEQLFFQGKQFVHEPRRCRECRSKRSRGRVRYRTETKTTCSQCGEETTVPFRPTRGLPVVCRACFQKPGYTVQPGPQKKPDATAVVPVC
jgi:CxxC-x17-CxxC domain-containing protein